MDPLLGCDACDLPDGEGFAAKWWTAKPPIGNTHPGATLPFGMVSVCAYSGAYVTGYGRYDVSLSGDSPKTIYDQHGCYGLAHFQQSGTGRIRVYYNYLLTTPVTHLAPELRDAFMLLDDERAEPGYYAGHFPETGITFETIALEHGIRHKYTFQKNQMKPAVFVNAASGGLYIEGMRSYPQGAHLSIESPEKVSGTIIMEGIPLHFTCICKGGKAKLWQDDELLGNETSYELSIDKQKFQPDFGFCFEGDHTEMELTFAFSLQESERASDIAQFSSQKELTEIKAAAAGIWEEVLGKIEVKGGSKEHLEVFYTALYHSLIKPADFTNENPFRHEQGPFFFDLSTLWDLYKTHLPLMMTLWPEKGTAFIEFLHEVAKREGGFPISYLMDNTPDRFTKQATGLCHIIMEDARLRGIQTDWESILHRLWKTSSSGKGRQSKFSEYSRKQVVNPLSHTLDIAQAHFSTANMAKALGVQIIHDQSEALSKHWTNAFDKETGLLKEDSTYYEGEHWNYSFRLLHDMQKRIELAGGTERFVELLDQFFGFAASTENENVFHFEGLNNEPDMESPFAYLYAGRHDRTAEIVQAVMRQRFGRGRGGLPGNDDSGGLSSWFVWNACGIFPVAGQPVMLIGSPLFEDVSIHKENGDFRIIAPDPAADKPYITKATLNGKPLNRAWLKMSEFQQGGTLEIVRSDTPSSFGTDHLPPSF